MKRWHWKERTKWWNLNVCRWCFFRLLSTHSFLVLHFFLFYCFCFYSLFPFLSPLLPHLLRQGYFLPVSQFADKQRPYSGDALYIVCVLCVCVHAYLTSGRLVCVYICVFVRDREIQHIFDHLLPVRACVCGAVCVCPPVVTVLNPSWHPLLPATAYAPQQDYWEAAERERGGDLEGVWRQ